MATRIIVKPRTARYAPRIRSDLDDARSVIAGVLLGSGLWAVTLFLWWAFIHGGAP
jgi:hypothetical protein